MNSDASKSKEHALVICLFVFLFVVLGGGLHLNPGGALLAAATGTALVIYAFDRRSSGRSSERRLCRATLPTRGCWEEKTDHRGDVTKSLEFSALTRSTAVAWSQEDHAL